MIKKSKKKKIFNIKNKIINTLMTNGEKKTGEKILLKFAKKLQKATNKNFKNIVQFSIVNSTSTFKLNEQIVKKGKRKATKIFPSFITNDSLRIMTSLKFIKNVVRNDKNSTSFYESFVNEVLASSLLRSQSVNKKNELQKQILINKRYLSKFR